jgi:hypothetical protein
MLLCWQVDAAKAHVPGCEEWGKSLRPGADLCERQSAVLLPPVLPGSAAEPHLGDLLKAVCSRGVSCRSTV